MAVLLAPYNNAMRLGQGFNSYTQQICLSNAVKRAEKSEDDDGAYTKDVPGEKPGVSQIVSYSSRFVDKLSDVTDAMNISASLSIKTATIGGAASGSFVDSDKFKASDLNFFIQVRVTNQTSMARDYTEFNKLTIDPTKFTEVYGDSFISGYEEGGELNALISVKVSDKNKTFKVKAALEASLGTPALSGEVKGSIDLEKSNVETSTETTVTVNWSGGGQIKASDVLWDVNSLTLAAANFPDLVSRTPQRTYAILTKYSSLPSFHQKMGSFSPLDYENAGIYTAALLDSYMDYKSIWKQIQLANFELQNQRADMTEAKPVEEVLAMKAIDGAKFAPESESDTTPDTSTVLVHAPKKYTPAKFEFKPYKPTVLGLERARLDCRLEMIKIVKEVDQVTKDPDLALDPARIDYFVSSSVFKSLLPIVRLRPVEVQEGDTATPPNPVILGVAEESKPIELYIPSLETNKLYKAAQTSADQHRWRSRNWSMGANWAGEIDPVNESTFFNDMDVLDSSWVISKMIIYHTATWFTGIRTTYTNGKQICHGDCTRSTFREWDMSNAARDRIVKVCFRRSMTHNRWFIDGLYLYSARAKVYGMSTETPGSDSGWMSYFDGPSNGHWSFRGFWGNDFAPDTGFLSLGCVWGRESQPAWLQGEPDTNNDMCPFMENAPKAVRDLALRYKDRAPYLRFSKFVGTTGEVAGEEFWSHLEEEALTKDWKTSLVYPNYDPEKEAIISFHIRSSSGVDRVRGAAGGTKPDDRKGVETQPKAVLFTVNRKNGALGSVTFYSSGPADAKTSGQITTVDTMKMAMQKPELFGFNQGEKGEELLVVAPDHSWRLAGLYGYSKGGIITRVGVIWGKL